MGRPRKIVQEAAYKPARSVVPELVPDVADADRADLPKMLADAKARGDAPLVAAILRRCSE